MTISDEIAYSRMLLEQYNAECGGWLFGRRVGGVWYLTATRLGSGGRRKPEAVQLDYAEAEARAHEIRLTEAAMRFTGRSRIDRALEHAFATYDVAYLYADPWKWQDELAEWSARWPDKIVEFPTNMNTRMAPAVDRFRTALEEGRLRHDGDHDLTRHVLNARLRKVGRDEDGRGRYTLEKAGPGRLIDACVASVVAVEAAAQIMNLDKPEPRVHVGMTAGKKRKTFEVPEVVEPCDQAPVFIFGGLDRDRRDTLKPIAFDEHGNPLYAPRGFSFRLW